MKKLIIFDLDGVLVDSVKLAHHVISSYFTALDCQLTYEDSLRLFSGKDEIAFKKFALENLGIEVSDQQFKEIKTTILKVAETELEPLNEETLKILSQKNISFCVASNNWRNNVIKLLEITDQIKFFPQDNIFTSQQVEHGKPAPDLFLYAAKQLGYNVQDCIVVEDSVDGVQAGLAAQMPVVAFLGGSHAKFDWYQDRIKKLNVKLAYNSTELIDIILK